MYIFEINLKNSPSAPCHNKEGRGSCVFVFFGEGGRCGRSAAGNKKKWMVEEGVKGYIFPPIHRSLEKKLWIFEG